VDLVPDQNRPWCRSLQGRPSRTVGRQGPAPDLALIIGVWDRLADECKRQLIDVVRVNLPTQVVVDEFDEFNERGE